MIDFIRESSPSMADIVDNMLSSVWKGGTMKSSCDMVCIDVEDNGQGMNENIRKHLYEPIYTS